MNGCVGVGLSLHFGKYHKQIFYLFQSGRDRDFNSRGNRQSAPKVDDENDFPSLG